MYHEAGNFGQVRVATLVPTRRNKGLFSLNSVGWHRCNDLYHIARPEGCEYPLILITTGGCGVMSIDGTSYSLTPGSLAFIPRNIANSYRTPEGGIWEFYWLHPCGQVSEEFLDAIAQRQTYLCSFTAKNSYEQRVEKLIKLCSQNSPIYLSQSLSELLHLAAIDLLGGEEPMSLPLRALAYIEEHYNEELRLTELARKLFVSPAHLIRVFKQEHGCTPHQYLITYRLAHAAQLLKYSGLQIQQIASSLGFSSPSHLGSCFYKKYGCTPLQYQNRFSVKASAAHPRNPRQ